MNNKVFRRNPAPKPKSASSTFISLHFNKSDEDQLEISYKNDKKVTEELTNYEIPQSNFYIKKDVDDQSEAFSPEGKKNVSVSDSAIKTSKDCNNKFSVLEDKVKSSQCNVETDSFQPETNESLNFQINDDELKLSPAIEAAEVVNGSNFNHYINDELEKAKSEILDFKNDSVISSSKSEEHVKFSPSFLTDSRTTDVSDISSGHKTNIDSNKKANSPFYSIIQNFIILLKFAQNSVKFHLFIAASACVFAPIPSWLSGFLIGTILSCSLVYWLYKPQKDKKNFYNFNFASSQASHFQKETGILKGWMNELPSSVSYNPEQYHVSTTRSVYVRLEGSYLRFSFPQKNIPKRAMFNEPCYEKQFIYQQHYDIADATVELLPQGLSNKRLWSKKYPICLRIPNHRGALLSKSSQRNSPEGSSFSAKTNKKEKFLPRMNEENEIVIYLFSRTDRDKSLWFFRFLKASTIKMERSHSPTLCTRMTESKRNLSVDFAYLQNMSLDDEVDDNFVKISLNKQQKFEMYMTALFSPLHTDHPFAVKKEKKDPIEAKSQSSLSWLNVLIGRLFFDFLVEDIWAQHVSAKIQKKLNRIKLPFFLSELSIKDINLGSALPKIHSASDPSTDERGLWVDMDVSYNGSFHMTLETKLNLDRFKDDEALQQTKLSVCNSDEDSLESSSDEECLLPETNEDKESSSCGSTSKKFLKLMDKLAQSSYFQHAAKNKYVKRAMDDLSNTPLILTVEVQWLTGTLAVNIPPWPTDRLWYGFRTNPSLSIIARPKLGQHVVTFTQITEWIEKKLTSEFQVLVMPNMDDLIIPIMQPGHAIS